MAGLAAAFGSGAMTNSIADIAQADVILVIGSNTTEAHPIIALQIKKAVRENGAKLIVIDPRKIKLVDYAHLWLRQKPGTNVAVINGLMNVILEKSLADEEFIANRTEGIEELKAILPKYTLEVAERISGVPATDLRQAARIFAQAERATIIYSMGITQHTTGTDNVLSIANLAMLTGNIGKPGTGVNPLRGQNNVQGACDMGALPTTLTGYQKIAHDEVRAKFEKAWSCRLPKEAGLSVVEMFEAALQGKIKAMYIMGENPMLSDPDITHIEKALRTLDFLVVQDIFLTETAEFADVVLPGATFAEKDGTFTSTERKVQRVRKAINPPGKAKADWEIICDLAKAMGYEMGYSFPGEITDEIASLTSTYGGILFDRVNSSGGIQWPCPSLDHPGTTILYQDKFARGLGKFHPVEYKPPSEEPSEEYPLILTTGRLLFQYHTGTMTRRSKGLEEICPAGPVEINLEDAAAYRIKEGEEVILASRRGKIKVRVNITERSPQGTIFLPFHFSEYPANVLTNPALDPLAKIPEFKVCAVRIEKL